MIHLKVEEEKVPYLQEELLINQKLDVITVIQKDILLEIAETEQDILEEDHEVDQEADREVGEEEIETERAEEVDPGLTQETGGKFIFSYKFL